MEQEDINRLKRQFENLQEDVGELAEQFQPMSDKDLVKLAAAQNDIADKASWTAHAAETELKIRALRRIFEIPQTGATKHD